MRKITSLIVCIVLFVSVFSNVYASSTANTSPTMRTMKSKPAGSAYDEWTLNYHEDFSLGTRMWSLYNTYYGEELVTMPLGFSSLSLDENLTWKNYMLEFDYKLLDYNESSSWFRFFIKGQCLLYRLNTGSVGWMETVVGQTNMRKGGEYHFRCVAVDSSIKVYISGDGIPKEKLIAEMENNAYTDGNLNFIGYYKSTIDNVKVWVPNSSPKTAKEKIRAVVVGDATRFDFLNNDGTGLTYVSLKEDVASVDETGLITANKNGWAVIQAKDFEGNIVDTMGVYCYNKAISYSFESSEWNTFYVGDTISINCRANPSNSYVVNQWSLDNEKLGHMYGSSSSRRALTFDKPGKLTLTVKDMLSDAEISQTFIIKSLEEKEKESSKSGFTKFYLTGKTSETSQDFVGVHGYPYVFTEGDWKVINALNMGTFRTEYGVPSEWRSQTNAQKAEYANMSFEEWVTEVRPGYHDVLKNGNFKTYIFSTPIKATTESVLESVKYMKEQCDKYGKELVVELGNETYSVSYGKYHEKAEDYFIWAAGIADAIHEYDPNIKCIVCGMDASGESNILSDPNNNETMLEGNWGYTQAGIIYQWNALVKEYSEHFDGMTIHDYCSWEFDEQMSEEDFIEKSYAWTEENRRLTANLWERCGLPLYHTESGNLAAIMFWGGGMTSADKIRYQWQAYPFTGIRYFEQMLGMIEEGHTKGMNFHCLKDTQGFGVVWGTDSSKQSPVYINLMAMSGILQESDTFYQLNAPDSDYYVTKRGFYHGNDRNTVVNNVEAWGFGKKNEGVQKVVISNRTNVSQTVSIAGAKIKPTWSYGGTAKELLPDWMKNQKQDNYLMTSSWDEVITSVKPKTYEGASAVSEFELEPYTIAIFEVSDTPEILQDTTVGKITGYAEEVMENSLALYIGKHYAYRDNIKVKVDQDNDSVVPVIKNGRTLIPLRFVAESFGCDVEYDNATRNITIKDDGIDINMTVGETIYTVNGQEKMFDVPVTVDEGRTLIPLRALAEAIKKEVYWDDRGLIAIYPEKAGFVATANWFNESMTPHIDSLVSLFYAE